MSGSLFLAALVALLGAWVLWPLRARRLAAWQFSQEDTALGRLVNRKEVLLGNISDLDFEFAMGKLSEGDYRDLRDSLKRQTLGIMEQIEVLLESAPSESKASQPVASKPPTARCTDCGGELPTDARFCPHCGSSLS
jgi:hypothetical protein